MPTWAAQRIGADFASESCYNRNAQGFDVNRDFWYDLSRVDGNGNLDLAWLQSVASFPNGPDTTHSIEFGYFLNPEARAWVKLFNELTPEFLFACHHEGTNEAGDTGEMVQVALLGQACGIWGAWDGQGNLISWEGKPVNNSEYTGFTGDVFELGQKVVLNTGPARCTRRSRFSTASPTRISRPSAACEAGHSAGDIRVPRGDTGVDRSSASRRLPSWRA